VNSARIVDRVPQCDCGFKVRCRAPHDLPGNRNSNTEEDEG
jgi:hypothetical protein